MDYCRSELRFAVVDGIDDRNVHRIMIAAYLAGPLRLHDVIPQLRTFEESEFVGHYGGPMGVKLEEDEVDPFYVRTFSLRQIAQLSLRRLGSVSLTTDL